MYRVSVNQKMQIHSLKKCKSKVYIHFVDRKCLNKKKNPKCPDDQCGLAPLVVLIYDAI